MFMTMVYCYLICTWKIKSTSITKATVIFFFAERERECMYAGLTQVVLYLNRNGWCKVVRELRRVAED